jgi:uncharacterized RDD family membrane protein YckC
MSSVPISTPESAPGARLPTAGLPRRMACLLYEGLLLFGVLMAAGLLYAGLTEQRNAMLGRHGLQAFLFIVIGVYFAWFWSRGGQTVAMKTWRIRLVRADGAPLSQTRAAARYLLSWLWFGPALLSLWLGHAASAAPIVAALSAGAVGYAALVGLDPDRQFWHDTVCGTRLVDWQPEAHGSR